MFGLFPANSVNDDDIEIYADESREEIIAVSNQIRQQLKKAAGAPNNCLADFIAPKETKIEDHTTRGEAGEGTVNQHPAPIYESQVPFLVPKRHS